MYVAAMNLSVVSWVFEATNERQDFLFFMLNLIHIHGVKIIFQFLIDRKKNPPKLSY